MQQTNQDQPELAFGPTKEADLDKSINLYKLWRDPLTPSLLHPLEAVQGSLFRFLVDHRVRATSIQLLRQWIAEGKICESPWAEDFNRPGLYSFVEAIYACVREREHREIATQERTQEIFEVYLFGVMPGENDEYRSLGEQREALAMIEAFLACYEAKDFQEIDLALAYSGS